ncbi:hypothetical protein [Nocardia gamkensis]|uniref:Uncharacterized protein n=1 Tax=Nocardia gamkensis TaxID=352869 RepID=A0A7X6LBS0_9NOCA|nr:hypothetical protein [Nocardia gamkensis]NKY31324.1 hypothetical protein [Nocardia gamkensis]
MTEMLTDPALTGMTRADFAHLVAVSEPYWDALTEAAFQRRFHRPRGYLHPQTSSVDHFHRLLTALLRRRRAVTSTLLAQLLGVTRTNLSNQFRDGHRILDLHRIDVSPVPGSPARRGDVLVVGSGRGGLGVVGGGASPYPQSADGEHRGDLSCSSSPTSWTSTTPLPTAQGQWSKLARSAPLWTSVSGEPAKHGHSTDSCMSW